MISSLVTGEIHLHISLGFFVVCLFFSVTTLSLHLPNKVLTLEFLLSRKNRLTQKIQRIFEDL